MNDFLQPRSECKRPANQPEVAITNALVGLAAHDRSGRSVGLVTVLGYLIAAALAVAQ